MARPKRNVFEWNPTYKMMNRILGGMCDKTRYKYFRSASSAYIKKKPIRDFIFSKSNVCVNCGSNEKLQIDHIKSVYNCFNLKSYNFCNSIENLQVLCMKCNSSKKP